MNKKFEYYTVISIMDDLNSKLEKYGLKGYELVGVVFHDKHLPEYYELFFKKEINYLNDENFDDGFPGDNWNDFD